MTERYTIAIVGAGPAGISAAARAAARGVSHILLEKAGHYADTIVKYQRGKAVMATPDRLKLRSDLSFEFGVREEILGTWDTELGGIGVNVRFGVDVTGISGQKGDFRLKLRSGEEIEAEAVILGIGVQGNIRKLRVPGAELPFVQYTLDDPEAYVGERIVVIGAGDAAIENAIALSANNKVTLVNRRGDFARAKTGNLTAITKAIEAGALSCAYYAEPAQILADNKIELKTRSGEEIYACDRVIARLGADPPRKFVEACGVTFHTSDPGSFPQLSRTYESSVPGLYIIGALAGFPLIKHCMNQGYDAVEYILGNDISPADEELLQQVFAELPKDKSVNHYLNFIRNSVPLFRGLTTLQLREFMIESAVHVFQPGHAIIERNDYGDSLFNIAEGQVGVEIDPNDPSKIVKLSTGAFFGEIGLISGRRRGATVRALTPSVIIETPRRAALKLVNSVPSAKRTMDEVTVTRELQNYLGGNLTAGDLEEIVSSAEIKEFALGDRLITEGERDDKVYFIRSGSVTVSRQVGGRQVVLAYYPAGHYVGEAALVRGTPRGANVTAAIQTSTIVIDGGAFRTLLEKRQDLRERIERTLMDRQVRAVTLEQTSGHASVVEFLVRQGMGEATDILLIDESLCIRCDNCEKACAETHGGISRLDREAGPTFAMIHVPTSCRHCENPHCMTDCPPDSIHRGLDGEVWIDHGTCIGCGNCERNCPYGVIQMAETPPPKPGLLQWLLFGRGPGPGEDKSRKSKTKAPPAEGDISASAKEAKKLAVKCDMCKDISGGPACVRGCPTGAAIRVNPETFFTLTQTS